MTVEIEYDRSVSQTAAYALIAEGWNEIVQDGYTPELVGVAPFRAGSEVLMAVDPKDRDVVGVLVWDHDTDRGAFIVRLAYVEPSSRQQGVFTEMMEALKARATKRAVVSILATAHQTNKAAQAALMACKLAPVSVEYEFAVS